MRKNVILIFLCAFCLISHAAKTVWPDGTPIDPKVRDTTRVDVKSLGRQYVITDYGVVIDSSRVQTAAIQAVIDRAAAEGGGVVVLPEGTFLSGALFFRPGTHLHLRQGAVLKGSERIADFPIRVTRIEGQTCKYFTALINADGLDGFTITGRGTVNGNGYHYWKEFWIRREWNPQCTNKDAQRPRLVYLSNCKNVTVQDVRLVNSPFWTNHLYRCSFVRYLNVYIYSSTTGVKGPSTDAIDIDFCHDILVHGCYMNVNDDAVVLKGGKGTWADKDPDNGPCSNILIQHCHYGTVHGCLTLGSESLHDRNVILRDCVSDDANRVLWLKMRPDTPQHYEFVTVENMSGRCGSFLVIRPWTQFFQPEKRDDMPLSTCNNIVMKHIRMDCQNFFDVGASPKYALRDFTFEQVDVQDVKNAFATDVIQNTIVKNVKINGKKFK
ncbi:MAG: glycosyl hydrolase family 28 protein [Prevotella sp.]|nr:glycosyl hydrolase family 28 protein [Prevotella sp.]